MNAVFCIVQTLHAVPHIDIQVQLLKFKTTSTVLNRLHKTQLARYINLIYLSLSNNHIEHISDKIFSNHHFLIFLDISQNYINMIFPHMFQKNKKLSYLLVQNNFVTNLPVSTFWGIESLVVLNLSSNVISSMEPGCFKFVREIHMLDLSFNHLTEIPASSVDDIPTLSYLNLTENVLLQIEITSFVSHVLLDNLGFCCALDTKHCSAAISWKGGSSMCGTLFKKNLAKVLLWTLSFFGMFVNIIALSCFIISKSKSIIALLHCVCISCNTLLFVFALILLISDRKYGFAYSYLHQIWREHMLCYVAGVTFIFSKQVYLHSCLGQTLLNYYIVSSPYVIKPGKKSQILHLYLFAGGFVYVTTSITVHFFINPSSDICLSLAFQHEADNIAMTYILTTFALHLVLELIMIVLAVRVTIIARNVEMKAKKKRKKTWITKMCLMIAMNCIFGFTSEGIALSVALGTVLVPGWVFIALSIFPGVLYPGLIK